MGILIRRCFGLLFGIAMLVGGAGTSTAHDAPSHRELLLQVDDTATVGVIRYSLVGNEVTALLKTYDLDRDGRLGPKEGRLLASVMAQKAVVGLRLSLGKSPLPWKFVMADVEAMGKDAKKISVKGLCEWPHSNDASRLRDTLALEVGQRYGTLHLQMQTLGSWLVKSVSAGSVSTDSRGIKGRLDLASGKKWNATLERKAEK